MWNYKLSGLEMSQGVLYCDVPNATNITHNKKKKSSQSNPQSAHFAVQRCRNESVKGKVEVMPPCGCMVVVGLNTASESKKIC